MPASGWAVGAESTQGNDVYLSGSKLLFDAVAGRNLLVNLTLRSTRANQGGLLGFGGDAEKSRSLVAEGSVGLFVTPNWVVGMEYRQKPDNLGFAREDDLQDLYSAYFFNKHVSLAGDDEIVVFFADSNIDRFVASLEAQICHLSDGPCVYSGSPMDRAHQHMGITDAHFNALVEHMQQTLIDQDIDPGPRNRLLGRLARLHADIMSLQ